MPVDPDSIGIGYQIDLTKLADSIRLAKAKLASFHTELADLAKKASVTITVKDQAAKVKVKKFANAIQATLNSAGKLEIKKVPEAFGKIAGAKGIARMKTDFETLNNQYNKSTAVLGRMNAAFKKVNIAIVEQALRMKGSTRAKIKFIETANRVNLTQQVMKGKLEATAKGFRNLELATVKAARASELAVQKRAAEKVQLKQTAMAARETAAAQKALAAASISTTKQLQGMGITSKTSASEIKAMKLSSLDTARVLDLTRTRMEELRKTTRGGGRASKEAAKEFTNLQQRMPHLEHEANKGVKAFGDYRRAMDRWGAGFKYMMLSQAAWIASGAILFGTITAIGTSIKTFIDFHQDLRDAAAIVQATTTGYEKMEKAAVKAFLNSTMSLKDTTNALKILGQTGMEAADAAIALETVYKITTATGADTATTVKFLTTAINVWKLDAEDAARVGNILGAALNYSKLEAEDLGVGFNYTAAMAKSLGLSIVDLASIFAVMSNAGIKISTIGTGLRGVFSKLLSPTDKLEKQLKLVELTLADVSLETNNFFDVLKKLETAGFDIGNVFKGMTRREAASLNVMLEQGVERFNLMRKALKDTTAVEVMFERSMRGMKNQLILTGHAIQQYMIDRLNMLKPVITGTAIFVRELITTMGQLHAVYVIVGVGLLAHTASLLKVGVATSALIKLTYAWGVALNFIKAHPVFIWLAALTLGLTFAKIAFEALTTSVEEQRSVLNRRIDDMRKLQILMLDSNRTEEEKLRIMEEYSKDYPELLDLMKSHKIRIEDIIDATKELIAVDKEHQRNLDLRLLAQLEADLERLELTKKTLEKYSAGDIIYTPTGLPTDISKEIEKTEKAIDRLKIKIGLVFAGKVPLEGEKQTWTGDMEKALEKLRLKAGSEREKAKKELIKGLEEFGMTEEKKTGLTEKQLEARTLLYQKYNKKIIKIKKTEQKESDRIDKIIFDNLLKRQEKLEKARTKEGEKILKERKRQEKEIERSEEKSTSFLSKVAKFKEDLLNAEADLEKDNYTRKLNLLEIEIGERRRKYNELLENAKRYYNELNELAKDNPLLIAEKTKIEKLIKIIETLRSELSGVEGMERGDLKKTDPSNIAGGLEEGLRAARETLTDEYTIWKNLAQNTAMAMRDSFSDLFFDGMKGELKSLGDYWKAFGNAVKREIANMAASWVTSGLLGKSGSGGLFDKILGIAGGLFSAGSSTAASSTLAAGGTTFHSGGQSRGGAAFLKEKEYVIQDPSARSIGLDALNFMNKTGKIPSGGPNITNVHNSYTIVAMDSESMDQALRRGGAKAIQDISIGSFAYEKERRNPVFAR